MLEEDLGFLYLYLLFTPEAVIHHKIKSFSWQITNLLHSNPTLIHRISKDLPPQ
jgi:hypothetical protein